MLTKIDFDDFMNNNDNADLNHMSVELMQDPEFVALTEQWSVTKETLQQA